MNFKINVEFPEIIPRLCTTTLSDTFDSYIKFLIEYTLSFKKIVCIANNTVPAMTGDLKIAATKLKGKCKEQGKYFCIILIIYSSVKTSLKSF